MGRAVRPPTPVMPCLTVPQSCPALALPRSTRTLTSWVPTRGDVDPQQAVEPNASESYNVTQSVDVVDVRTAQTMDAQDGQRMTTT
jgi:hypothetical protein